MGGHVNLLEGENLLFLRELTSVRVLPVYALYPIISEEKRPFHYIVWSGSMLRRWYLYGRD